jgi:hypothetical protein
MTRPAPPASIMARGGASSGHQRRHPAGRRGDQRRQRLARDGELLRVERGARHRERGLDIEHIESALPPIVLQKSPSRLCEMEFCNNRIRSGGSLESLLRVRA